MYVLNLTITDEYKLRATVYELTETQATVEYIRESDSIVFKSLALEEFFEQIDIDVTHYYVKDQLEHRSDVLKLYEYTLYNKYTVSKRKDHNIVELAYAYYVELMFNTSNSYRFKANLAVALDTYSRKIAD